MGSDAKTCRSTPIVRPIAAIHELRGSRVLLRQWRPDDLEPFARQNADAVVMEHFPARMTDAETEFTAELFKSLAGKHSLMVVEHDMGFVGAIADHVTVLHQGSVLAEGSLEQVQENERVIEVYLGR